MFAIAVIEPLGRDDHGFGWGSKRAHHLFTAKTMPELIDCIAAAWGEDGGEDHPLDDADTTDPIPESELLEVVEAACKKHYGQWAEVASNQCDDYELLTDWLPSAGSADSWGDDVWLGLADYLSLRAFGEQIGYQPADLNYTLTDEDADACIRNSGEDAVRNALAYLTASDPIYPVLKTALERAAVS